MSEATYVYCVLRRDKAPPLGRAPRGLPGMGPPRALSGGRGLWLIAADAPLDRYGEEAIEKGLRDLEWVPSCAVPHEAVIEHASRAGRSEEHTSELQSHVNLVCRLLLEKK